MNKNQAPLRKAVVFFLKNFWFSISVNTAVVIIGIAVVILTAAGDLKPNDAFIAMAIIGLNGMFIKPALGTNDKKGESSFFLLLPLSRAMIIRMLFLSSAIYNCIVPVVFMLLICLTVRLPHIGNPHVVLVQVPSGEVISLAKGYITDESGRAEIPYSEVMPPSLLFGIVKTAHGYPVFPLWPVLLLLFFASSGTYFSMYHNVRLYLHPDKGVLHSLLLSFYLCIFPFCIADYLLPGRIVWQMRGTIDKISWLIPLAFLLLSAAFILTIIHQVSHTVKQEVLQ